VGLLGFREGTVMDETGDDTFVTGAGAAGMALHRLHACGAELDRRWTHADEVARLVRRAPASCARAGAMAAARPVDAYEPLVPSHRDLHPQHVIVSGEAVGFIDLDDCALAPPGLDVGNMVAHLRREALVGRRRVEVAARAVSAFLEAYGAAPPDLSTWVALALARLAGLAETHHGSRTERNALLAELAEPDGDATSGLGTGRSHPQMPVPKLLRSPSVDDGATRTRLTFRPHVPPSARSTHTAERRWLQRPIHAVPTASPLRGTLELLQGGRTHVVPTGR